MHIENWKEILELKNSIPKIPYQKESSMDVFNNKMEGWICELEDTSREEIDWKPKKS